MNPLTKPEALKLKTNERIIAKTQKSFYECGKALEIIRDGKLYREHFSTFEEYTFEKWGWGRQRAHQMIEASNVKESLPENVNHGLQNERQARALLAVPKPKREKVLKRAIKSGKVTANSISEAIKVEEKAHEHLVDKTDKTDDKVKVPKDVLADWSRAEEFKTYINELGKMKLIIEKGVLAEDVIFREVNNNLVTDLINVRRSMKRMLPYAVCTICNGLQRSKCKACLGRGYVSEFLWDMCVPQEIKKIRSLAAK